MGKFKDLLLGMMALTAASCGQVEGVTTVGADAFARGIGADKAQVVDVRTPEEYASGHIQGAVNIDVMSSEFGQKAQTALDKGTKCYVYCRSGRRSMRAAKILAGMGYRVVNLAGGIGAWQGAGKSIVP